MGVDSRRPLLPAPTDSTFHDATTPGSVTGTDLATDVSRRTDRTSYSIPDDGSPITISTRRRHRDRDDRKLSRSRHQSQTSLLIEYFEAGKRSGLHSRPSVRVRVTPSSSRKRKEDGDRIQISESGRARRPSYTRRISLETPSRTRQAPDDAGDEAEDDDDDDDRSVSSVTSAPEDIGTKRRPPVEIEFVKDDSEVSSRYIQPPSDISTIPPDSMLDSTVSKRQQSQNVSDDEAGEPVQDDNLLKTPSRRRSRSLSRERIAQKAAEKVAGSRASRTRHRIADKTKDPSQSKAYLEPEMPQSPRRRSGPHHRENDLVSPESSLLSNSQLSSQLRGGDQYSFRSNTSKSSINNPKLLETVEDAIRRLILPELKELKKDQKVQANRSKFERDTSISRASGSATGSKDQLGRSLSKHASAPDVSKHRHVASQDSLDAATPVSAVTKDKDNQRASRPIRVGRRPSAPEDEVGLQRKKSRGLRHAEAARIVETRLTEAALRHHDSQSTIDKSERSRRESKARSRSGSVNETELVFQKHDVPPMPFRSEIETELTRESILSQQTDTTAEAIHGEVPRASLQQLASHTPPRSSPKGDAPGHRYPESGAGQHYEEEHDAYHDREPFSYLEPPRSGYGQGRTLSPIQSVASERDDDNNKQNTAAKPGPTPSPSQKRIVDENDRSLSIGSLSSAPSTDLARSTRAATISTEKRDPSTDRHDESGLELGYEPSPKDSHDHQWGDDDGHSASDVDHKSRHEYTSDSRPDSRRLTDYTADDSYDEHDEHDEHEEQDDDHDLSGALSGNAQLVHSPVGVESDVASLLDPSVVDRNSALSANNSVSNGHGSWSPRMSKEVSRDAAAKTPGSPLKQVHDASSPVGQSFPKRMGVTSPPQSVENSSSESLDDKPRMGATALPTAGSPIPEIGHIPDSESEINTNPSIIQGPIGGVSDVNHDHWPYAPTPPRLKGAGTSHQQYYSHDYEEDYGAANKAVPDAAYNNHYGRTSPVKDEGYISGANPRSTSSATPEPKSKERGALDLLRSPLDDDDFFNDPSHNRHLSNYSHGMSSPLYDSATGHGIDNIQSKDIVALMDHLTVRDAQRNARDTELLVTLVRSAAEMRNSFEDMKRFIAQQDEKMLEANDRAHDNTRKVIGGPRPYPGRTARQASAEDEEDARSKRKSVFRRALRGLTMKSSNDLTHIEDMLMHLLAEVEALRAMQEGRTPQANNNSAPPSVPETQGQAPEKPHGLAPGSSPQRSGDAGGPSSGRRISPVMEGDEDDEEPLTPQEQNVLHHQMSTDAQLINRHKRAESAPFETPEQGPVTSGTLSTDTTPKTSNEKSRKHKSSSSSFFFPKISRWSKTTASSMGDNFRNAMHGGRKDRLSSEMSRSGSDLAQGAYTTAEYYDHRGDDRLRSEASLARDNQQQENRPPSPLVPSQVSENPRYRAHRDSLNLQHPQPRPGARYQNHLESQAQNFGPYMSPKSEAWASNPTLNVVHPDAIARQHSPMSDGGYSFVSSRSGRGSAPPRPPKIKDDGPLIPRKPAPSTAGSAQPSYAERVAMREGVRPNTSAGQPSSNGPQRRLTGPRPYTSPTKYAHNQPGYPRTQQYRGSPVQVDDDDY